MPSNKKLLQAAAGNAGGGALYVEDVFSTYLYTGTGSAQTITNGIDLAGEGGLVWIKKRGSAALKHLLFDTERGIYKDLNTDDTSAEDSAVGNLTAFNSDGFSIGNGVEVSSTSDPRATWTFRKAEKFFDVVTYTGNNEVAQYVNHNLGVTPAVIILKSLDLAGRWYVWHKDLTSASYSLRLNTTAEEGSDNKYEIGLNASDTQIYIDTGSEINGTTSNTYVAYLFASDAGGFGDDGDENIIKCGSYTGNGSTDGPEIDLGFEPQWILLKDADVAVNWYMFDNMRGIATGGVDAILNPNTNSAESASGDRLDLTPTGFKITTSSNAWNRSGSNFIYIAIRRPMKTPESGTEVFESVAYTGNNSTRELNTTILADAVRIGSRSTAGWATGLQSRLTGKEKLLTSSNGEAAADSWGKINAWDYQDAIEFTSGSSGFQDVNGSSITYIAHAFKRATGFFDVVAYTGTGSAHTEDHNLKVVPELMIVKRRSSFESWQVYSKDMAADEYMQLNSTAGLTDVSGTLRWNNTRPTDSVFSIGTHNSVNGSGSTYIAYLFATLAGVSKVGSYTGTGADLNVDCGFSAGARFIFIKRTDSSGDWYVWDSERGIVAGNDPYLLLNSTAAEVTSTDYIDPLSSGFTVTSTAPAALNASGGTYIFLAIA